MVTIDYDRVSTTLKIILIIELGIWVILAIGKCVISAVLHVSLVPIISCHDKLWGLPRRVFTLIPCSDLGPKCTGEGAPDHGFPSLTESQCNLPTKYNFFLKEIQEANFENMVKGAQSQSVQHKTPERKVVRPREWETG